MKKREEKALQKQNEEMAKAALDHEEEKHQQLEFSRKASEFTDQEIDDFKEIMPHIAPIVLRKDSRDDF